MNTRYQNEPEFRERMKKYAKRWNQNNKEYLNENARNYYAKMSKEKKDQRLTKIKKMRAKGLWHR